MREQDIFVWQGFLLCLRRAFIAAENCVDNIHKCIDDGLVPLPLTGYDHRKERIFVNDLPGAPIVIMTVGTFSVYSIMERKHGGVEVQSEFTENLI